MTDVRNIEHVHVTSTQTLLYVYASYEAVVAVLGPDDPSVIDVDKSWHGWEITTVHGQVDVYDWGRHYAEDISEDAPPPPVDAVVCWHVNARGAGHAAGALEVARRVSLSGRTHTPQRSGE